MRFDVVLRTFSDFFEKEGIRYAVVGGLAMQAWGASRFTKDADVAVDNAHRDKIVAFAESMGYETLAIFDGYSNHLNADASLGRLDFMYLRNGTADQVFGSSEVRPVIGDVSAPVARPEYLAMMKALSMKNVPQRALYEGEDVRLLLSLPGVDRNLVREYFARHDLLEMFNAIAKTLGPAR